ncbi:MAG: tRNA 2-thiouridine(34) synthase MnmA [Sedimentisphaerales bacterium]|nr:tRNA 2-thiouridine(34) synthase MnmA [Sedimentisphaerales bacterium]
MGSAKEKVCVAMSGGVDSSAAAALLLERGFDVFGVFMLTCDQSHQSQTHAQSVADKLGINLHIIDMRAEFKTTILSYFTTEYKKARTPNPCVYCNRWIKFGKLFDFAKNNGAEYFATGHYANILQKDNDYGLYAANTPKDQSYALAMIDKKVLPFVIFPMAELSKNDARNIATKKGLDNAQRAESQEICFIPNDDYISVLEKMSPELIREGDIIDSSGKVLAHHQGIHRYTIGQRRGLKVAMGKPYYVTKLDSAANTVTLGPVEELLNKKLAVSGLNWLIDRPDKQFRATVKIRYNDKGKPATVYPDENNAQVEFDEPVKAITPGQLAVFYIEQDGLHRIAAAGWIEKTWD